MDLVHSTWFWVLIMGAPAVGAIGTLIRLSRREPPPDLPPGVKSQPYANDDSDKEEGDDYGLPPAPRIPSHHDSERR